MIFDSSISVPLDSGGLLLEFTMFAFRGWKYGRSAIMTFFDKMLCSRGQQKKQKKFILQTEHGVGQTCGASVTGNSANTCKGGNETEMDECH